MTRRPAESLAALGLLVLLAVSSPAARAQELGPNPRKVVKVLPFSSTSMGEGEILAIRSLVSSAIAELEQFRLVDEAGQELALREGELALLLGKEPRIRPLAADFLLEGSVLPAGDYLAFSLTLTRVGDGARRSQTELHSSTNDVVLGAKRLAKELFAQAGAVLPSPPAADEAAGYPRAGSAAPGASQTAPPTAPKAVPLRLERLAGTWKGDKGIDRISLFPDGRGLAFLSNGSTMLLKLLASGSSVEIRQSGPSLPDYYRGSSIDQAAAAEIAARARPWRWIMALGPDGSTLEGVKESVFVRIDPDRSVYVDNNYAREAVWTRLAR